jgi:hypothetical protein
MLELVAAEWSKCHGKVQFCAMGQFSRGFRDPGLLAAPTTALMNENKNKNKNMHNARRT